MVTWDHLKNKKRYAFISTRLTATKLDKVMAYDIIPPLKKLHDPWSRDHIFSYDK